MDYNTLLTPKQEEEYNKWLSLNKLQGYIHALDTGVDYDYRGAFKAGYKPDSSGSHWSDIWKKPNHPTFSNQSKYFNGNNNAGVWIGDTYFRVNR